MNAGVSNCGSTRLFADLTIPRCWKKYPAIVTLRGKIVNDSVLGKLVVTVIVMIAFTLDAVRARPIARLL
jgi:hypothetical protein